MHYTSNRFKEQIIFNQASRLKKSKCRFIDIKSFFTIYTFFIGKNTGNESKLENILQHFPSEIETPFIGQFAWAICCSTERVVDFTAEAAGNEELIRSSYQADSALYSKRNTYKRVQNKRRNGVKSTRTIQEYILNLYFFDDENIR